MLSNSGSDLKTNDYDIQGMSNGFTFNSNVSNSHLKL